MNTVIYRSNYGLPLSKWDKFMNKLWFHVTEKDRFWAKVIYYPLRQGELLVYRLKSMVRGDTGDL